MFIAAHVLYPRLRLILLWPSRATSDTGPSYLPSYQEGGLSRGASIARRKGSRYLELPYTSILATRQIKVGRVKYLEIFDRIRRASVPLQVSNGLPRMSQRRGALGVSLRASFIVTHIWVTRNYQDKILRSITTLLRPVHSVRKKLSIFLSERLANVSTVLLY